MSYEHPGRTAEALHKETERLGSELHSLFSDPKYSGMSDKDRIEMIIMDATFCVWASNLKTTALVFGPPGIADALDGPSQKFPTPEKRNPRPVMAGFALFLILTGLACWLLSNL